MSARRVFLLASIFLATAVTLSALSCKSDVGLPFGQPNSGGPQDLVVTSSITVNECAPILLVNTATSTVVVGGSTVSFSEGDSLLLWQVTVATVGTSVKLGTNGIDQPLPPEAGRYQRVHVVANAGSAYTVTSSSALLTFRTDAGFHAQACSVPVYAKVRVTAAGRIVAAPWDEATGVGGLVAFESLGTTTLNASTSISASAAGFPGGALPTVTPPGASSCAYGSDYSSSTGLGGGKGSGIFASPGNPAAGEGSFANGGGGGNFKQSGGGGGGSAGAGGRAGAVAPCDGGRGGAALLAPSDSFLFLGGGGGAACCEGGGDTPTPGARGGGVVLIWTQLLVGSGGILANGESAAAEPPARGGGGGAGGGGTIRLVLDSAAFAGTLSARGGEGGGSISVDMSTGAYGPGGGGGGGRIFASSLVVSTAHVAGGNYGTDVVDGRGGAFPGKNGVIEPPNGL